MHSVICGKNDTTALDFALRIPQTARRGFQPRRPDLKR